ncbi:SMP-30/gluconolactonase/LRE family protein [Glaciibacter superstes]|nr:SMP-30/gluconolactonase/LRE family protein [Glaciibacter superstes]
MLADVVELPVTNVTSCTFGGVDLTTLFITTSRENMRHSRKHE